MKYIKTEKTKNSLFDWRTVYQLKNGDIRYCYFIEKPKDKKK